MSFPRHAFVFLLMLICGALSQDVILPAPTGSGKDVFVVMIQGAVIPAVQYTDTLTALQAQGAAASLRIWAGCPDFWLHTPEPLVIQSGVDRIFESLVAQGMPRTAIRVGMGHSLGGIMIQTFLASNTSSLQYMVLMGAFLNRKYNTQPFPSAQTVIPTLTIAGELDGLCRLFRIAESYYFHGSDTTNTPIVAVAGMSHMQFASGTPPSNVKNNDLQPEITYDQAHTAQGQLVAAFINSFNQDAGKESLRAAATLRAAVAMSASAFFDPILKSYEIEGNYQTKPPCNCCDTNADCPFPLVYHFPIGQVNYYPCPDKPTCRSHSPWGSYAQQALANLSSVQFNVSASFHPVSQENPSNLPKIFNNCSKPDATCQLTITNVNENVYASDFLDTGFYQQSAVEIRAKLMSRQEVWIQAGIPNADFNITDSGNLCAEVNQLALNWALQNAPASTVSRFNRIGQPIQFGADVPEIGGPWWIDNALNFNSTGGVVVVTSPMMKFPDPFPLIPYTCCFHYCKLLSPSRALEWLMIDGLRLNGHI